MDGKRKRKRGEEKEEERVVAGMDREGVRGGDAVSARTRTHAHVRTCAHRHTFKSIYICIDSVYNISIIDFFSLSLSN